MRVEQVSLAPMMEFSDRAPNHRGHVSSCTTIVDEIILPIAVMGLVAGAVYVTFQTCDAPAAGGWPPGTGRRPP